MEIWKDIKDYKGLYQISNEGRIKILSKPIWNGWKTYIGKEKIMKIQTDVYGYKLCHLRKDNKTTTFKVHRLTAEAFIPNPENKPTVNHSDGDKAHNYVDNLEWATSQENIKHAYDTGLREPLRGYTWKWKNRRVS